MRDGPHTDSKPSPPSSPMRYLRGALASRGFTDASAHRHADDEGGGWNEEWVAAHEVLDHGGRHGGAVAGGGPAPQLVESHQGARRGVAQN